MKLALNASFLLQPEWTGVCHYFYNILTSLAQVRPANTLHLLFFVPRHQHTLYNKLSFPQNVVKTPIYLPQRLCEPLDQLWQRLQWPYLDYFIGSHDIYLSPAWSYLPSKAPLQGIFALDTLAMKSVDHNQQIEKKRLLTGLSAKPSIWITISEFSRLQLIKNLNVSSSKIVVAYPGSLPSNPSKISPLPNPYLFYVGSFEPRKNLHLAFAAFEQFYRSHSDWRFVVISKSAAAISKQYSFPWLIILPYSSNREVQTYMHFAKSLVYPSREEGFGLPVLEALQSDTLAITSKNTSMTEITGTSWPLLCNPHSVASLKLSFEKVSAITLQQRLELLGSLKLTPFNYDLSAEKIYQKLESFDISPKIDHKSLLDLK
jgi:glycosyltransferase involved in cell wall biosynthesis